MIEIRSSIIESAMTHRLCEANKAVERGLITGELDTLGRRYSKVVSIEIQASDDDIVLDDGSLD